MPDSKTAISFDEKELKDVSDKLQKFPYQAKITMSMVVEDAAEMLKNHMQAEHFFVGTGKGSGQKAQDNVFTIRNPDGTPRFKIRTNNLVRSIQNTGADIDNHGNVSSTVKIGEKYARDVEEGRPGARAFPFVRPAIEACRGPIMRRALYLMRDAVKRMG